MADAVVLIEIPRELDLRLEAAHNALGSPDNAPSVSPDRRVAALQEYLDALRAVRPLLIESAVFFAVIAAETEVGSWLVAAEQLRDIAASGGQS